MSSDNNWIEIGKDEWIEYIDIEDRKESAINIDIYLDKIWYFIGSLELHCVAECCGIIAFDFTEGKILEILDFTDEDKLLKNCDELMEIVQELDSTVFVSEKLNANLDERVFFQLFEHIQNCIHKFKNRSK